MSSDSETETSGLGFGRRRADSSSSRESGAGRKKRPHRSFSPTSDDEIVIAPIADDDTPPPENRPLVRKAVAFAGLNESAAVQTYEPTALPSSSSRNDRFLPGQSVELPPKPKKPPKKRTKKGSYGQQTGRFRLKDVPSSYPPELQPQSSMISQFSAFPTNETPVTQTPSPAPQIIPPSAQTQQPVAQTQQSTFHANQNPFPMNFIDQSTFTTQPSMTPTISSTSSSTFGFTPPPPSSGSGLPNAMSFSAASGQMQPTMPQAGYHMGYNSMFNVPTQTHAMNVPGPTGILPIPGGSISMGQTPGFGTNLQPSAAQPPLASSFASPPPASTFAPMVAAQTIPPPPAPPATSAPPSAPSPAATLVDNGRTVQRKTTNRTREKDKDKEPASGSTGEGQEQSQQPETRQPKVTKSYYRRDYNDPNSTRKTTRKNGNRQPEFHSDVRPMRMITLLITDTRSPSGMEDLQLTEVTVSLRVADINHPEWGFWTQSEEVCSALQETQARIEGDARVFTMRGKYRQVFMRVTWDKESNESQWECTPANLAVTPERTLHIAVVAPPKDESAPSPVYIPKDLRTPSPEPDQVPPPGETNSNDSNPHKRARNPSPEHDYSPEPSSEPATKRRRKPPTSEDEDDAMIKSLDLQDDVVESPDEDADEDRGTLEELIVKRVDLLLQQDEEWSQFFIYKSRPQHVPVVLQQYEFIKKMADKYMGRRVPFRSVRNLRINIGHIVKAMQIDDPKFGEDAIETLRLLALYGPNGTRKKDREVKKAATNKDRPEYGQNPIRRFLRLLRQVDEQWKKDNVGRLYREETPKPPEEQGNQTNGTEKPRTESSSGGGDGGRGEEVREDEEQAQSQDMEQNKES